MKNKAPVSIPPREMPQIQQEYNSVCSGIGDRHYKVYVLEEEISRMKKRLVALNAEANERGAINTKKEAQEKENQAKLAQGKQLNAEIKRKRKGKK